MLLNALFFVILYEKIGEVNILGICQNGDVLSAFRIVNMVILIIKIVVPILLILTGMITLMNTIKVGNEDLLAKAKKQLVSNCIAAIVVFLVPTLVNVIVKTNGVENGYKACLTSATEEGITYAYITTADTLVAKAEETKMYNDYYAAVNALSKIKDETLRNDYNGRLNILYEDIKAKMDAENDKEKPTGDGSNGGNVSGNGILDVPGNSSSNGNSACKASSCNSTEPDPSAALNCWPNYINVSNFTFPKDDSTGKPLGAWPSNTSSIPVQLTGYKTYQNGKVILPTTPANGKYSYVYEHNGIDIMAAFGTPVYSPVDGTMDYSEWGHTVNKSGNETSYTVSIKMDGYITIDGKSVNRFFLTHMSGIRYRCNSSNCSRRVKMGELIGFTGNASGSTCGASGWAPHLHMTVYPDNNYAGGLTTAQTEKIYGLTSGMSIKAGG